MDQFEFVLSVIVSALTAIARSVVVTNETLESIYMLLNEFAGNV